MNIRFAPNNVYGTALSGRQTSKNSVENGMSATAFGKQMQAMLDSYRKAPPQIGSYKLSEQELRELAEKYDPENMTQREYDSFIEELLQKGVLGRDEVAGLGTSGLRQLNGESGVLSMEMIDAGRFGYAATVHRLADTMGNALKFAECRSLWECKQDGGITQEAFRKLAEILKEMDMFLA